MRRLFSFFLVFLCGCSSGVDFRGIVASSKNKVFPAVVYIKCLRESHESGKKVTESISGSGVIISATGEVVTNWHVVDKASEVRCLLSDGRYYDAKVLGSDKDTDLGLLQLDLPVGAKALPAATLGISEILQEGDFVMAMGAPWGLSRSVSIGIISCSRRYLDDHSEYSLWLQTDADIHPGNSGGPLVNTQGEVIGINTLGGDSLAFAVPSKTVKFVTDQIRKHGKVRWSWSGLDIQPLQDFEKKIYFDQKDGVIVSGTEPDSPAEKAGFKTEDCLLSIDGKLIHGRSAEDMPAVRRMLGGLPEDKTVKIRLLRKGREMELRLIPREKGAVEGNEIDCPRWDMACKEINQHDNPDQYFYRKTGIFVFGVKYPGNARSAGLSEGDILLEISGRTIKGPEDLKIIHEKTLKEVDSEPRHLVRVLRNGLLREFVLDISLDYEKR